MCRMSIAVDTARGLAYLHTADEEHPLVHRDVKRCVCVCACACVRMGGWGEECCWRYGVRSRVYFLIHSIDLGPRLFILCTIINVLCRVMYNILCTR